MSVKAIPEGYHSVTPYLVIDGAAEAIRFYETAFGASEVLRMPMGDKVAHAEVKIGTAT
jgi:PhnB protein